MTPRALVFSALLFITSIAGATAPNVLMIAIDDLNDWVGALGGHPQAQTPHMDRLAERGMLFANAHCQTPLCGSSRTSLMTGLRPGTTGVYGLRPWFRDVPNLQNVESMPQTFRKAGYRTALAGKIYHGFPPGKDREKEFDVYGPRANFGPFPEQKFVETPQPHKLVDWGVFPETDEEQGDWPVASWGVEQLLAERDNDDERPFFLAIGFGRPHVPCYASQKWFDLYPEETLQLPPVLEGDREDTPRASWHLHWQLPEPRLDFLQEADQWTNLVRSYLASISFVDSQVGRLLDALEASGEADNTVVVLWSDHGFHLGEKRITGKNTLWERSTRVPLIFAGPGIAQGKVTTPAELLDVYPTLVDVAGLTGPDGLEGHSLAPQLADPNAPRHAPAITTHNAGNNTVRTTNWRYIRYRDGTEELYHMAEDPNEWHNLAADPRYAAKKADLKRWIPAYNAPPAPQSAARILEYQDDRVFWEGQEILPTDPIPEIQ